MNIAIPSGFLHTAPEMGISFRNVEAAHYIVDFPGLHFSVDTKMQTFYRACRQEVAGKRPPEISSISMTSVLVNVIQLWLIKGPIS